MKLKKAYLAIVVILILIVSPFIISPIVNNILLSVFSENLYKCELPKDTILVDKNNICGKLNGNGNGMDYLAVILIRSKMTNEELENYFNKISFAPIGKNGIVVIDVQKQNSSKLESKYLEHGDITFSQLNDTKDFSNLYSILIYDGGHSKWFDIRGG